VAIVYGSVIRDEGKYRMWYLGYGKDGSRGVAYAESADGIAWRKPAFDFHRVDGQATNLLIPAGAKEGSPNALPVYYELFGVHKDSAEADPSRRYKLGFLSIQRGYKGPREDPFHRGERRGLGVAASPDGIHWKLIDSWGDRSHLRRRHATGCTIRPGRNTCCTEEPSTCLPTSSKPGKQRLGAPLLLGRSVLVSSPMISFTGAP